MPQPLQRAELEQRLLRWTGSAFVPRYPFFEGPISDSRVDASGVLSNSVEDLRRWFNDIELAANDCRVPLEQYSDAAIYFLKGDLKEVMEERREAYLKETKRRWWDWADFKEDLKRVVAEAAKIVASSPKITDLATMTMHPYIASSVKLGLVIGGTVVLLPALGLIAWRKLNVAGRPVLNTS